MHEHKRAPGFILTMNSACFLIPVKWNFLNALTPSGVVLVPYEYSFWKFLEVVLVWP
jgi:hypothetical protein